MKQSESVGNLALALSKAQAAMSLAEKSAQNPHLKNKYADLTSVWNACKDALTGNGLAVSQLPSSRIDDSGVPVIGLSCILMHESGEWVSCFMESPAVGNRGVNDLQAAGSVITYLRRYTLSAIVGVATGDDDDGSSVQNRPVQAQTNGRSTPPAFDLDKWYSHIISQSDGYYDNKYHVDGAIKALGYQLPDTREVGLSLVDPLRQYAKYRKDGREQDEAVDLVLSGQEPLFS